MSTALSVFREPIRVLIGDNDPDIQLREDAQLDAAMRLVINCGKVVGTQTAVPCYALNTSGTAIDPTLTAATDSKAWAQLVYHAAKQFAVDITPTHWHTRAFSETVGENRERVFSILDEIYYIDSGDGCSTTDYA